MIFSSCLKENPAPENILKGSLKKIIHETDGIVFDVGYDADLRIKSLRDNMKSLEIEYTYEDDLLTSIVEKKSVENIVHQILRTDKGDISEIRSLKGANLINHNRVMYPWSSNPIKYFSLFTTIFSSETSEKSFNVRLNAEGNADQVVYHLYGEHGVQEYAIQFEYDKTYPILNQFLPTLEGFSPIYDKLFKNNPKRILITALPGPLQFGDKEYTFTYSGTGGKVDKIEIKLVKEIDSMQGRTETHKTIKFEY